DEQRLAPNRSRLLVRLTGTKWNSCRHVGWIVKASTFLNMSGVSAQARVTQSKKGLLSHLSNFQTIAILPLNCIDQVRYSASCPGLLVEAEATRANLASHVKECPPCVFDLFLQPSASEFDDRGPAC